MDTYDQALINIYMGKMPDTYEIIRNDGYSSIVPVSIYFDDTNFSEIDSLALSNCYGIILDVGAGAGRHSTELQRRGLDVTAIDISEQAVSIMKERGINKTICNDVMDVSGSRYNTLLMLMNGIGMVGVPQKLDHFFSKSRELLTDNGVILVDSIDVFKTNSPLHIKYREKNISSSNYPGQQNLRIDYDGAVGAWYK